MSGEVSSFKVRCKTRGDSAGASNALRFATREEGERYGAELYSRWMALETYEVVESDEPVNYAADEYGHASPIDRVLSS